MVGMATISGNENGSWWQIGSSTWFYSIRTRSRAVGPMGPLAGSPLPYVARALARMLAKNFVQDPHYEMSR